MKNLFVILALTQIIPVSAQAGDLFYKKNLTLHVIHHADQGDTESVQLDSAVGSYIAEAGSVVYLKGQNLLLISNTRHPKPEVVDSMVSEFAVRDGVIAYVKESYLWVRRVSDAADIPSRRVSDSMGATNIDVAGDLVSFTKVQALYLVSDLSNGTATRVIYPVSDAQISRPQ